jgi:hypothetical protein
MSPEQLRPHLAPGEAIIWTGRPDAGQLARRGLSGAVSGAAFGAAFALFAPRFGFQGWILAVPWAMAALSLAAPIFSYRRAARTTYAVTDRRALVVTGSSVRSFGPGRVGHPVVTPRTGGLSDVEFGVQRERVSSGSGGSHDVLVRTGFLAISDPRGAEAALRTLLERLSRVAAVEGRLRHPVLSFSFVAPPGFTVTTIEPRRPGRPKRGFSLSLSRKVDPAEVGSTDWGSLVLKAPDGASCHVEVREQPERPTLAALTTEAGTGAGRMLGKLQSSAERDVPPFGRGYELVHALPMGLALRQLLCFPPGLRLSFTFATQGATTDLYGPLLDGIVASLEAGPSPT